MLHQITKHVFKKRSVVKVFAPCMQDAITVFISYFLHCTDKSHNHYDLVPLDKGDAGLGSAVLTGIVTGIAIAVSTFVILIAVM